MAVSLLLSPDVYRILGVLDPDSRRLPAPRQRAAAKVLLSALRATHPVDISAPSRPGSLRGGPLWRCKLVKYTSAVNRIYQRWYI